MAITTLAGYQAARANWLHWHKSSTINGSANARFSPFSLAGGSSGVNPGHAGTGSDAIGNTANGLVPTDATVGYPAIPDFGGNTGYLAAVEIDHNQTGGPGSYIIFDCLFACGSYAFNANTALASQPSYSGRVPGGTDFTGLEIWVQQVTAATGNQAVTVTYTNQAGTGGRSTGAVGIGAAPAAQRMWQLPLQAGDTGVQTISNVQGTVATAGTFNVFVMRRLWSGSHEVAQQRDRAFPFMGSGMPQIFETSALRVIMGFTGTYNTGIVGLMAEIVVA